MTATSDDNQPTAAVGDVDDTAVVAEGPRTVAAEQFSEPPTTIVPDVEPTRAAELAWSSEAETEELADQSREWCGRLLWLPLVALLCASVAVVVWFSVTLYRQGRPVTAPHSSPTPVAAPPVHAAPPPAAPIAPPPAAAPAPPPPPAVQSNITQQQANTICGWLRDPAWTMPQIESSTGDMLADDNPSFTGTPAVFKAIAAAMSSTCPDVANQRSF
ncbi:MAG: hypothetical protein WA622_30195 [Mycobacterium sp.]|uniref:hypothetical protein n=1 Tax=Mycobacterium sp. TaxID=1785 RepID=UPI003C862A10